ncbi:MAG TPA: Ada metal-binding domain-containing protein [Micropepsaceae bacterium]|nr:Ada metal-binding domain-containing protein [Micropepsaceae bacterium]
MTTESPQLLDPARCYDALKARDRRFDGAFFVGVRSTGVYCRPVCTARLPRRKVCTFHPSAASAEEAGFRPCLRCRPERAPGHAACDRMDVLARRALHLIERGEDDVEALAARLGVTDRHLRRVTLAAYGASPVEMMQTRRLLAAKELLADTNLPVTEIAYAAGFASLRRFNSLIRTRYRMAPTQLRRQAIMRGGEAAGLSFTIALRPPYDASALFSYLAARATPQLEDAGPAHYRRALSLEGAKGIVAVTHDASARALKVSLTPGLARAAPKVLALVRQVFDTRANGAAIDESLAAHQLLARDVMRRPGIRVAGAFDGFELGLKTVLGQQVSMKAARTLMARLCERFGAPFADGLHLTPEPARIADASLREIRAIGLTASRAQTIHALANAVASGALDISPGADPVATRAALLALPGIGAWTADYILMRGLSWPDACPASDLWLKRAFNTTSHARAEEAAQMFSPWRAYAAIRLWTMAPEYSGEKK